MSVKLLEKVTDSITKLDVSIIKRIMESKDFLYVLFENGKQKGAIIAIGMNDRTMVSRMLVSKDDSIYPTGLAIDFAMRYGTKAQTCALCDLITTKNINGNGPSVYEYHYPISKNKAVLFNSETCSLGFADDHENWSSTLTHKIELRKDANDISYNDPYMEARRK